MRKGIKASLLFLLVMTGIGGAAAQSPSNQPKASGMEADVTKIKQAMLGNWESIAPEVRPSAARTRTARSSRFTSSALSNTCRPTGSSSRSSTRPTPTAPSRSRGSRSAGTCCGRARIRSLRAHRRSTSLPTRATRSLPSRKGLPTCSTRSPRTDMLPGRSTRPRAYSERPLFRSL